jgi:hypothetical protein
VKLDHFPSGARNGRPAPARVPRTASHHRGARARPQCPRDLAGPGRRPRLQRRLCERAALRPPAAWHVVARGTCRHDVSFRAAASIKLRPREDLAMATVECKRCRGRGKGDPNPANPRARDWCLGCNASHFFESLSLRLIATGERNRSRPISRSRQWSSASSSRTRAARSRRSDSARRRQVQQSRQRRPLAL